MDCCCFEDSSPGSLHLSPHECLPGSCNQLQVLGITIAAAIIVALAIKESIVAAATRAIPWDY